MIIQYLKFSNIRKRERGVRLIVKRRITEIIFWIFNIVLIKMSFRAYRPVVSFVTTIICSMPMNPLILNRIQRRIDDSKQK